MAYISDVVTCTNKCKTTFFAGAKGLRSMLQEQGKVVKLSPKPPKRDIRSGFSVKEDPKTVPTNNPAKNGTTKEAEVNLNTDAACFACDACTQTGGEGRGKEKGCNVM